MRLIDAEALKKKIRRTYHPMDDIPFFEIMHIISNAPTVEERPKGKWIYEYVEYMGMKTLVCSECHYPMGQIRDCFCANCGARMESEENG